MDTYAQREQRCVEAHLKMKEVAAILNGTWENPNAYEHGAYIHLDNCSIWYRIDNYKNKIEILSHIDAKFERRSRRDLISYEEEKQGAFPACIGASLTKTAEQLAKDITRRLLPDCIELQKRAEQRHADKLAWDNSVKAKFDRLQAIIPSLSKSYHSSASDYSNSSGRMGEVYFDIYFGSSINLKLNSLTIEQAEQILKIVAKQMH